MHVLFVHPNYPAQFGHIAQRLARDDAFRCTFVSKCPAGLDGPVERVQFQQKGGATVQSHFCSRSFENAIWESQAIFEALRARPDITPDLVVGHSGFGSTVFLREIYDCPILNYFEYFYHTQDSDMDFRPEFPSNEMERLRARARNAAILLDLENCDRGYCPTLWQRDRFPKLFQPKLDVVFDGVDLDVWKPQPREPRNIGGLTIPDHVRVITYVARGMESLRGFDIFCKIAKQLCERRSDVLFLVVGQDRVCYGGDLRHTGGKSFKEWVFAQDDYDLSRFRFLGLLPPAELARLFSLSDLHIYLTVPFVLSWSLFDALACGTTVLASNTAPVRELVTAGENGLLADFYDVDEFVRLAEQVLDEPEAFRHLGENGQELIRRRYSLDVCLPRLRDLYSRVARDQPLASIPESGSNGADSEKHLTKA
jgi:glycosyltransferase involved in cell wall biosynthesis